MGLHDEETERYLREFQPRAIRPLEVSPKVRNALSRQLLGVAVVTLFAAGTAWYLRRETPPKKEATIVLARKESDRSEKRYASTVALTRLALEDNEKLDALFADESRKLLPTFQEEQSTLKVLARE